MPNFDRSGPTGAGGLCAPRGRDLYGRGFRGGGGPGRGFRRGWAGLRTPYSSRYVGPAEDELTVLRRDAAAMKNELDAIHQRISDLER